MPMLVYGYARTPDARRVVGLPGVIGCAGEPLTVVSHQGLSAIVGELERSPEAKLDVLRAFQTSVTALHEAVPLVPSRFGAAADEDEVQRFLMARDSHLHSVLDLVEGCDEWSVRVKIESAAPEPAVLAPAADPGPGGVAYLRRRKEAFDLADGVPARLVELCRGELKPIVDLARATRLEGPTGAVNMPGVHLLVPRDERGELERLFGGVVREMKGRVLMTGPWPAYSFVSAAV